MSEWPTRQYGREDFAKLPKAPKFSVVRHRTMENYQRALDEWKRECAEARLGMFDAHVRSLGMGHLLPEEDR